MDFPKEDYKQQFLKGRWYYFLQVSSWLLNAVLKRGLPPFTHIQRHISLKENTLNHSLVYNAKLLPFHDAFIVRKLNTVSLAWKETAHRRWKVEGTESTQNWKRLLLRVRLAQVRTMTVTTMVATTARMRDKDSWPSGARPWWAAGGSQVRINRERWRSTQIITMHQRQ